MACLAVVGISPLGLGGAMDHDLFSVAEWKYSAGRFAGYAGFLLLGGLWSKDASQDSSKFTTFILGFGAMLRAFTTSSPFWPKVRMLWKIPTSYPA